MEKWQVLIVILFAVVCGVVFVTSIDTNELDEICSEDGSSLVRSSGLWDCGVASVASGGNTTINNYTNNITNNITQNITIENNVSLANTSFSCADANSYVWNYSLIDGVANGVCAADTDTDTWNTTAQIQAAINNSGDYNFTGIRLSPGEESRPTLYFNNMSNGFHLNASGVIDVNAENQFRVDLRGGSILYDFQLTAFLPAPTGIVDLGGPSNLWKNGYFSGNVTIDNSLTCTVGSGLCLNTTNFQIQNTTFYSTWMKYSEFITQNTTNYNVFLQKENWPACYWMNDTWQIGVTVTGGGANSTITANRQYVYPIVFCENTTIDLLGYAQSMFSVGQSCTVGFYNSSPRNYTPMNLVVNTTYIPSTAVGSSGILNVSRAYTFNKGLYWGTFLCNGSTMRPWVFQAYNVPFNMGMNPAGGQNPFDHYFKAVTVNTALTATVDLTGFTKAANSNTPMAYFHVVKN